MKKIKRKILRLLKKEEGRRIIIGCAILLGLILGYLIIGIKRTLILGMAAITLYAIKYGGSIMAKRKTLKSKSKDKGKHINKKEKGKRVKPKSKFKKILRMILMLALIMGILGLLAVCFFLSHIVKSAPAFDPNNLYRKEASIIYDSNGDILAKIGREIRDKISYYDLPEVFIDAIIATEDARFFQHNGFDLPRFFSAGFGQIKGQFAGGASTISMQVVKNSFTSTEQSYVRKFTDIYLSIFKLEKKYTKEEIIEFYVNTPYLGNNSYGVAEAARNYFGKEISDINLTEAAMLAGLFQAPSAYDPYIYPDNTAKRRSTVLNLMQRHGYINEEERKIANSIPIEAMLIGRTGHGAPEYQGYIDVAIEEVFNKTGYDPYNVPMRIYTNLSIEKQNYLNKVLSGELFKFPNDVVQLGVAVTDINTGAILAIGNGRNRTGERLYNFATMLRRQIGSTAKPIFSYGPGMELNNWSTYTPFLDDTHSYSNKKAITNWDGRYQGILTSRDALARSRNIPALKAFQQIDNKEIIKFVESLGMTPEIEGGWLHEAHSIGAFNGASPLQMAAAYAAFGNGGYYIEPYAVHKIEYIETNVTQLFKSSKERVMSDSTAFMITDILRRGVDEGAVAGGKVPGIEIAAKSGTTNFDEATKKRFKLPSNALNDFWYVGYSPDYSIGMWFGYEKIDSKYYHTPATWGTRDRLFTTLAKGLFDKNGKKFEVPKSVVRIPVEKWTVPAMLASPHTPSTSIVYEYFKRGTEPTEISPKYRQLPNPTNVDINVIDNKVKLTWNHVTVQNTITEEFIKMLGIHKDKYLNSLQQNDLATLGNLGYNVYLKMNNDLILLGWTANNEYTHYPSTTGNLTYVIKTSYSLYQNSKSSGSEITLSSNPYVPLLEVSLLGGTTIDLNVGDTYTEQGVLVMDNLVNVTNDASISKTTTRMSDNHVIPNNKIDTSQPENFTIKYTITYKGEQYILTRTVKIT
jgi:penicillin-binding protein 1A